MQVHVDLAARCRKPRAVANERVNLVVGGREAQRRELQDLGSRGEILEEARDTLLARTGAEPRRRGTRGVRRPVHVVGNSVENRANVGSAKSLVDLPYRLEIRIVCHQASSGRSQTSARN